MTKFVLRNSLMLLLVPVTFLLSFSLKTDRASFSGSWKLDEAKSELGQFGNFTSRTLKVEQKENDITLTKVTPGFNGGDPVTTVLTVAFDGKVTESEGFGGSKRKSTAKWSADGQSLVFDHHTLFERDGQSFEMKSNETWTLKDGVLSVITLSSSPRGESTIKAVYTK